MQWVHSFLYILEYYVLPIHSKHHDVSHNLLFYIFYYHMEQYHIPDIHLHPNPQVGY